MINETDSKNVCEFKVKPLIRVYRWQTITDVIFAETASLITFDDNHNAMINDRAIKFKV